MWYIITIFLVSILSAFMILNYSAFEVRSGMRGEKRTWHIIVPPIRHLEKYLLYFLKHLIQSIVLLTVKYWILFVTRLQKWWITAWPKIQKIFTRKKHDIRDIENQYPKNPSFLRRAIFESKIKIKRMKQKIREDNDMQR